MKHMENSDENIHVDIAAQRVKSMTMKKMVGNDRSSLNVWKILLFSNIRNLWRAVWRICSSMLGCKESIYLWL